MRTTQQQAANRTLSLDDLERPEFRRILAEMDQLVKQDDMSYLHPSKRWEYPWALQRAELAPHSHVLDAGCGASIFPIYLAKQGYKVAASDVEVPFGLDRQHGVEVEYVTNYIVEMPFTDEAFDAVFCVSVVEHLHRHQLPDVIQELRRVLRPGGRLLVTTDYYEDASAELWFAGDSHYDPFPVDWCVFDESQLTEYILEAPGLRVEGDVDLDVNWDRVGEEMRRFHGYPYTSVGVTLVKE